MPLSYFLYQSIWKIGEHPFSRSYGVILPSSFDMVLSSALVYSTCSPVSVWGTVIFFTSKKKCDTHSFIFRGIALPIRSFFLEVPCWQRLRSLFQWNISPVLSVMTQKRFILDKTSLPTLQTFHQTWLNRSWFAVLNQNLGSRKTLD